MELINHQIIQKEDQKIEKRTQKKVAKMKKEKVKKPNIIFVQLESHFDITQVKGVKFNKDPLPNFHKYMKGYSSGQLSMPSYGAGTANSEFELITGMNLDHFGAAEYPYKTVLQNTTTESMATVLKNYDIRHTRSMITVRHFMIEIWYSHSLVLIHLQQKKV